MKKRCSKRLVMYEIRNVLGNPFVYIFGIFFPIMMLFIITRVAESEVPPAMLSEVKTAMFITMSLIIPMAVVLLGYSSLYSQELQDEIPLRMELFGFQQRTTFLAKVIAQFVVMTAGLGIYTIVAYSALELQIPRLSSALILILCLYLSAVIFFVLAHGVSEIFRKFGPTYAIMMTLYFGIMILCGMMGIRPEQLPKAAQNLAKLLPMSYISNDFIEFWTKGSYNFAPMIQSFLFFGAISGIIFLFGLRKQKRKIK